MLGKVLIIVYIDLMKFKIYVFTKGNTDNQNTNTEISTTLAAWLHVLIAWALWKDLKQ